MSLASKLKTLHLLIFSPTSRFLKYAKPGHYYSPLPAYEEVADALHREASLTGSSAPGVDLQETAQVEFVKSAARRFDPSDFPLPAEALQRYRIDNSYFGGSDGAVLVAMLDRFKPRRIIEVGSGFSSALMLDATKHLGLSTTQFQFIEPYPERLLGLVGDRPAETVSIRQAKVQDVPLTEFDRLEADDILFIDSSHVSKAGSDVNFLFFHVLPRLKSGVIVHIHDIHWPFEYPQAWYDEGRVWNEAYLLRALLMFDTHFKIVCFVSWLQTQRLDLLNDVWPFLKNTSGGSIWLRRD